MFISFRKYAQPVYLIQAYMAMLLHSYHHLLKLSFHHNSCGTIYFRIKILIPLWIFHQNHDEIMSNRTFHTKRIYRSQVHHNHTTRIGKSKWNAFSSMNLSTLTSIWWAVFIVALGSKPTGEEKARNKKEWKKTQLVSLNDCGLTNVIFITVINSNGSA